MKKAYGYFLILIIAISCNAQNQYWEELNESQKAKVLSLVHSELVLSYYEGNFKLSDDNITIKLLDDLIQAPDSIMPLTFYLFNNICESSDGALTEMIIEYCIYYIAEHPEFVFAYFKKHNRELMDTYAMLIGYELYLKDKGLSNTTYDYTKLKSHISTTVDDNSLQSIIDAFWSSVDEKISNMK